MIDTDGVLNLYEDTEGATTGTIMHVAATGGRGVTVLGGTFNMTGGSITGGF